MAKIYGSRWKIEGTKLGHGGQSEVFSVIDLKGEYEDRLALKRVLNPSRNQRFLSEIEAIKRIQHPNIIKLVDHSALDDGVIIEEKQYLVMPIARGGVLSDPGRLALYRESPDSVLLVVKQITQALIAAHATRIIHRDIKPQNILFSGNGHEVWVADFGICLIRELPRTTETGEVVGPRSFMAPELEDGGILEVTPAADIYSLGKVIYYMLSGGVIFPREKVHEARYRELFPRGGRYSLLQSLLERMICPLDRRIREATEVAGIIDSIADWDRNAQLIPMSSSGHTALERLQQQSLDAQRVVAENMAVRERESTVLLNLCESFMAKLEAKLTTAAAHISQNGVLICDVRPLTGWGTKFSVQYNHSGRYVGLTGLELHLEQPGDQFHKQHLLQVWLCKAYGVSDTVQAGHTPVVPGALPMRDFVLAIVPYYLQPHPGMPLTPQSFGGYLTARNHIGRNDQISHQQRQPPFRLHISGQPLRLQAVTQTFHNGASLSLSFNASEWPSLDERFMAILTESIDIFLEYVATGAQMKGP
ncbi:MAG: serine/threonine-protein kinase [Nitrospirota bacterium]|nr:serine/threonine-protein kinase [Nitrospirota bacterium]